MLKDKLTRLIDFFTHDIWRIRSRHLKGPESFWIRNARVILLALRGFDEDKCQLRASALTYYSLLSIVPVIAMAFGIAKGFGFEKMLEQELMKNLKGQEEVVTRIIEFSNNMLANTQGGLIAGVGVVLLFWAVINVLSQIEMSFNEIWGIKKERPFGRKFADYLSIMLICPFLMITAGSATVLITSQITFLIGKLSFLGPVADVIILSLKILPYAVLWFVFTFLYIFMPNTKVQFKSGLIAGVVGGTMYQLVQWVYITFQVGVANYGAVYGSFAALPLFLVWLQLSWLVMLLGAEIAFAHQNEETYEFEPDSLKASRAFKRLAALLITHHCVKKFLNREKSPTAVEISHELEMPIRLTQEMLFELTECGVLTEVKVNDSPSAGYHPGQDVNELTIKNVIDYLDQRGADNIPIMKTPEFEKLTQNLAAFQHTLQKSPHNLRLKEIS